MLFFLYIYTQYIYSCVKPPRRVCWLCVSVNRRTSSWSEIQQRVKFRLGSGCSCNFSPLSELRAQLYFSSAVLSVGWRTHVESGITFPYLVVPVKSSQTPCNAQRRNTETCWARTERRRARSHPAAGTHPSCSAPCPTFSLSTSEWHLECC